MTGYSKEKPMQARPNAVEKTRSTLVWGNAATPALGIVGICMLMWATASRSDDSAQAMPIPVLLKASSLEVSTRPSMARNGRFVTFAVIDGVRHQRELDDIRSQKIKVRTWNAIGADVWVADLRSGTQRKLFAGDRDCWAPSWSPDGATLAFFCSGADGEVQLWKWEVRTDTVTQVKTSVRPTPDELQWTSDGTVITSVEALSTPVSPGTNASGARAVTDAHASTARVFDFDPSVVDSTQEHGQVDLDAWRADIAHVYPVTGSARRLAEGARPAFRATSPDRKALGWVTIDRYPSRGSQQILGALEVADLGTSSVKTLVADAPLADYPTAFRFSWSPDGKGIAYETGGPEGAARRIYYVSRSGGSPRLIVDVGTTPGSFGPAGRGDPLWFDSQSMLYGKHGILWRARLDASPSTEFAALPGHYLRMIEGEPGQLWSPDSGKHGVVQTFAVDSKRSGLALVDLRTRAIRQLFEENKRYGGYADYAPVVAPDRQTLVYIAEDSGHARDVWIISPLASPRPVRVSHVAPELEKYALGGVRLVHWLGIDGEDEAGALMLPAGYRPGTRYPMILRVYGGIDLSESVYRFGFAGNYIDNEQVFASRGYVVLEAGGTLHVGTPMLDLAKSILPGVNKVVELGVADNDRIGIIGHSYGGANVLDLIVESTRFRAAISSAGESDLVTSYGTMEPDGSNYLLSWAETGQGRMGGSPWEYRDRFIENSPFFYLDRASTPILLIHGGNDQSTLADQTFTALRRLGKRVEYARYEREDHHQATWSMENQADYWRRVLGWFERYLAPTKSTSGVHSQKDATGLIGD